MQQWEFSVLEGIQQLFQSPAADRIMPIITMLGNYGLLWILIAVIFLCLKRYRIGGMQLSAALMVDALLCNVIIKPLAARQRPYSMVPQLELLISEPVDFSFPSGHTAAAFAAAVILYHIDRRMGIAAYGLAVMLAFSRLYLYVHFPTDVLAGAVIGMLCGAAALRLVRDKEKRQIKKSE